MSVDMSQFHQVFFDESQEHLDEMEQLLMAIDITAVDDEQLNSIFRAAHSIKGGSGIFGFDHLAQVTHIMESLLDLARKHLLQLDRELVDEFLITSDVLKAILAAYRSDAPQDTALISQTKLKLQSLLDKHDSVIAKQEAEQGFGLFEQAANNKADEDFGFFTDVPSKPADEEDSFGFFDSPAPLKVSQDDGFGLFEPVTDNSPVPTTDVNPKTPDIEPMNKARPPTAAAKSVESATIRVDTGKVDNLVNMVGELVITQSMLSLVGAQLEGPLAEKLQSALLELDRNTREIQDAVMSIRMLPISFVFNRFPRLVRDLSTKLGKEIDLLIEGGNTEIDKSLIEKLADPLTHLVRNSIDHGVELPAKRLAAGKNPSGRVILKAQHRGGNIQISIIDDGAGLNRERILQKAADNHIEIPANPTDQDIWQLVFAPGFSTAEAVTDVSGRGVGMDVVKRNITDLGGSVEIDSRDGLGASFHIYLPLTLAILDGMGVSVGGSVFIIPLVNIIESIQPKPEQIKTVQGSALLKVRGEYWPLLNLYEVMGVQPHFTTPAEGIIVLVESNQHRFGLFVDALEGQQQAVIKSLEKHYKKVNGLAGATIMGDGSVALILDIESLARLVSHTSAKEMV
ncbi:chemotaxis protein CheA [Rheinheimera sp. UJ63]|uniref:chemotaxis protein CheA n=1 Tax=Rheinheimera sp. UJ63 TaxID=2910157 RepID=UPI001F1F722F|nr:chemotaxis protein CheW [Rheinheimera sp. UJ63]MCF4009559.1 chemotaxis protein CheW [Rheinheimera sp. UJ63]